MIGKILPSDFAKEVECVFEEEKYSVRDNGAVMRHSKVGGKRSRAADNRWTFGKPNNKNGYMYLASVRIHRIVATAFHGDSPTKEHVVDHIDTNKRNNRANNLRWLTKWENVMMNPITVRKIEFACGCSVEEFMAEPAKYRDTFREPSYAWMCSVSKEEAAISLQRMQAWAKSGHAPVGGSLGDWIYKRREYQQVQFPQAEELTESLTPNAVQRDWKTPSLFPSCPPANGMPQPLKEYAQNLKPGSVFCENKMYASHVVKAELTKDGNILMVLTESSEKQNAIKPFALAKIVFGNGYFVHASEGTFFKQDGAEKQYCLALGHPWTGGETFDVT